MKKSEEREREREREREEQKYGKRKNRREYWKQNKNNYNLRAFSKMHDNSKMSSAEKYNMYNILERTIIVWT